MDTKRLPESVSFNAVKTSSAKLKFQVAFLWPEANRLNRSIWVGECRIGRAGLRLLIQYLSQSGKQVGAVGELIEIGAAGQETAQFAVSLQAE